MNTLHTARLKLIVCTLISFLLLTTAQTKTLAAGSLVITPTRINFDQRTRSETVTIVNTSSETGKYRISFVRRHMLEDGNLIEVPENEEGNFSDEFIRYSPRQVTLAPGQSQIIRLLLRKPKNLPAGEYRSHMLFQALPDPAKNEIKPQQSNDDKNAITIQITSLIGITIPVIVRHGTLDAELSLSNPKFIAANNENPRAKIMVDINRSGTRSIYGNFKVEHIPEGQTSGNIVGQVKGVAVYTPNNKRRFTIHLNDTEVNNFTDGKFKISYIERDKTINKNQSSEVILSLP